MNSDNDNNGKNTPANDSGNKLPVVKQVKVKSSVPTIATGVIFLVSILFGSFTSFSGIVATIIVASVVSGILKSKFPNRMEEITFGDVVETTAKDIPDEKPEVKAGDDSNDKIVEDFIERGELYITNIRLLNEAIKDKAMSDNLTVIEDTLRKMFNRLREEKDKQRRITQLNQFMEYYMPMTIKILDSYRKIEQNALSGANVDETKKRIAEMLPFIRDAFLNELDNMYKDEMIDITTDIAVMEQMLAKDGLLDINNINKLK